jgi:hypothetical protein
MSAPYLHPLSDAQVRMLPRGVPTLVVPCPACASGPGEACTGLRGPNADRVPIRNLHTSRVPRESFPSRYGVGTPDVGEGYGAPL